jgi:hypothetical protein
MSSHVMSNPICQKRNQKTKRKEKREMPKPNNLTPKEKGKKKKEQIL